MAKSSSKGSRVPFEKWISDLASGKVDNLSAHMSKLQAVMSDLAYLDETFEILVRMGLPKAAGQTTPWLYNVERKRFNDAFTSPGKNDWKIQLKYASFVMESLNLGGGGKFHSVEGLAEITAVKSLDYMVKYYTTAKKAEEQSLELRIVSRERLYRVNSFLEREEQTIAELSVITKDFRESMEEFKADQITLESLKELDKDRKGIVKVFRKRIADIDTQVQEEESKMPSLLASKNDVSILTKDLREMQQIWSEQVANIMLKFEMNPNFKPFGLADEIKVEIEVIERLKKMCKRIEILGNILLTETDVTKKNKFEEDLKKEEEELKTFSKKDETIDAFANVNTGTLQLTKRACQNEEIIKETIDELLIDFNEHTRRRELLDQYAALEEEIRVLIGIDEGDKEEHDNAKDEEEEDDDEDDKENTEENEEKLEISGEKKGGD